MSLRSSGTTARLLRGAAILTVLQGLEQVTGLFSHGLIAAYFGASAETDAYLVATTIVGLLGLWFTLPVNQVLIPIFRHDLARRGEARAWRTAGILLNNLSLLFVGLVVAGWLLAPLLVRLVAVGFSQDTTDLAASLTRITVPAVVLIGAGTFLTQLLLSYERFFLAGAGGSVRNLCIAIGLVLLGSRWGVHGLAIAMVIGNAALVATQIPILWKHRRFYEPRVDFRDERMRELGRMSGPVVVSAGGIEIERVMDRMLASFLSAGSLAALAFAGLLAHFPRTLLLRPFQQTIIPHFARLAAERDFDAMSRQLSRYLRALLFLTVPAGLGMMLLSDLIVRIVYERGAFDETAVRLTSHALFFYAIGLPGAFLGKALNNTYLCLKDTRTPMKVGLWRLGVKVALALALMPFMAHAGIALAGSLSHTLRATVLYWWLPESLRPATRHDFMASGTRTVGAAAVMGGVVWAAQTGIAGRVHEILQLGVLVALGISTYFVVSWLCRQSEFEWISQSLLAFRGR